MSNIISTEPKPQAPQEPQAVPDGNAVASLIRGIVGITVLPLIASILAVILGRASIGDAYKRGERGSTMATAGVILGWIGVAVPVVLVVVLFIFTRSHVVDNNTRRARDSGTFCLGQILHAAE